MPISQEEGPELASALYLPTTPSSGLGESVVRGGGQRVGGICQDLGKQRQGRKALIFGALRGCHGTVTSPTPYSTEQTMPITGPSQQIREPARTTTLTCRRELRVSPFGEQDGDGCLGGSVNQGRGLLRRLRKSSELGGGEQRASRHHLRPQAHPPMEAIGTWHPADSYSAPM